MEIQELWLHGNNMQRRYNQHIINFMFEGWRHSLWMDEQVLWPELKRSIACTVLRSLIAELPYLPQLWWWHLPNFLWLELAIARNLNLCSMKPDHALLSGLQQQNADTHISLLRFWGWGIVSTDFLWCQWDFAVILVHWKICPSHTHSQTSKT